MLQSLKDLLFIKLPPVHFFPFLLQISFGVCRRNLHFYYSRRLVSKVVKTCRNMKMVFPLKQKDACGNSRRRISLSKSYFDRLTEVKGAAKTSKPDP